MQGLNLIRDAWIPVRHKNGRTSVRAPHELFGGDPDDRVVAVATPRADLDGGLVQLLIGLLHAALAPADERAWRRYKDAPPEPDELRGLFEPFAPAFELLGTGPRFHQDPSVVAFGGESISVEKLLIDLSVGEGGGDLFARNGSVGCLCLPCAAAALATLQASAPAGGRGNMTSLRGGGPLTTLVLPVSDDAGLWKTLWLNVVPLPVLGAGNGSEAPVPEEIFPWLRTPKIEPKQAPKVTPEDAPPLQAFFGMPRRIWLGEPAPGCCGLCGAEGPTVAELGSRPNGNRYAGAWRHPLSPYRRFKDEGMLAVKGDARGIGYRHWLGLVVALPGGDIQPALPVRQLESQAARFAAAGGRARLWAFGYAMDNMKAEAWSEGQMPIYEIPAEQAPDFAAAVGQMVAAARHAEFAVRKAFKSLVARRAQDVKRDPEQIVARFWQDTEASFYEHADRIRRVLRSGGAAGGTEELQQRLSWHKELCRHAKAIFDTEVGEADFRAVAPHQVAEAWKELQQTLHGKKLRTDLGLPVSEDKKKISEDMKKKGGRS